ncbi:MAG TPA: outer membrane protein assembly factor BamA [Candidatus Azoamicus sp.]
MAENYGETAFIKQVEKKNSTYIYPKEIKEEPKKIIIVYRVKKIFLFGSDYVSVGDIRAKIKNVTNYLGMVTERKMFRAIAALKYFEHIKFTIRKKILVILVKDRPFIRSIKIFGDDRKSTHKILKKLKIKKGKLYEHALLILSRNKIQDTQFSRGYLNTEIFIDIQRDKDSNCVDIQINVLKHNNLTIKEIDIKGNKYYSKKKILSLIRSSSSWTGFFTKRNTYIISRMHRDIKRLKTFYFNRGFRQFHVTYIKIIKKKNNKDVNITIKIDEGMKFTVNRFIMPRYSRSLNKFFNKIARNYVKYNKYTYSKSSIKRFKKVIYNLFLTKGVFSKYEVRHRKIHKQRNKLDIYFYIKKRLKPKIRRIKFIGNYITSDVVLRQFFTQLEDAILQRKKILRTKKVLLKRGYIKRIKVRIRRNKAKPYEADLIVRVKERKINKVVAGCNYSEKNGLNLTMSGEFLNFIGSGNNIGLLLIRNKNLISFKFSFLTPRFMNTFMHLKFHVYYKLNTKRKKRLLKRSNNAYGVIIRSIFKVSRTDRFGLTFGSKKIIVKVPGYKNIPYLKKIINVYGLKYRESYIAGSFTHSTLRRGRHQSSAALCKVSFKWTTPMSTLCYYTVGYKMYYYKKLIKGFKFNLNFRIKYGNRYGKTEHFPFYKNYFLKGKRNIRGYANKTLGPRNHMKEINLGGNFVFSLRLSITVPLPKLPMIKRKKLRSAFFFDIGQVYDTSNDFDSRPTEYPDWPFNSFMKYSCGMNIIWKTPAKVPIELTFAYPLNASFADNKKSFTFSIGINKRKKR